MLSFISSLASKIKESAPGIIDKEAPNNNPTLTPKLSPEDEEKLKQQNRATSIMDLDELAENSVKTIEKRETEREESEKYWRVHKPASARAHEESVANIKKKLRQISIERIELGIETTNTINTIRNSNDTSEGEKAAMVANINAEFKTRQEILSTSMKTWEDALITENNRREEELKEITEYESTR